MNAVLPLWVEWLVSILLVCSALFALLAGWGAWRLGNFFQRMHPPALLSTAASWCVTLASITYFSSVTGTMALSTWLIIIVLSISVPISTMMIARAALFRKRQADMPDMPPPLHPREQPQPQDRA